MKMRLLKIVLVSWALGATALVPVTKLETNDEVLHLIGEPDFRDVALRWQYEPAGAGAGGDSNLLGAPPAFQVHYCEIQAWGPHRCRTKVIDRVEESPSVSGKRQGRGGGGGRNYGAQIRGLRMATTYSFEVRPVDREARDLDDLQSIGKSIIVPTKGFSARATQCLPHASEVEVSTGPYFGGRIAVEAIDGGPERCALQGNPASAQDTYTMRIRHEDCGSAVNDTTVATYVIVQENLPILTHSTRRFLVLCTHKPDTLTVRAGINLPRPGGAGAAGGPGAVEPLDEDYAELQPARLEAAREEHDGGGMFGEMTLMAFLVVICFAAVAVIVWKLAPRPERGDESVTSSAPRGLFGRLARKNIDRFSDISSVYSVTLSERDDCESKLPNAGSDNSSEA